MRSFILTIALISYSYGIQTMTFLNLNSENQLVSQATNDQNTNTLPLQNNKIHPVLFLELALSSPTYQEVNSEDLKLDAIFYKEQSSLDQDELFQDNSQDKTDNFDGYLWER